MKPDYKNRVPKGMIYGLVAGTVVLTAAFIPTDDGMFMTKREAAKMMLKGSSLLVGRK